MKNNNVVITGSSKGIGLATATKFLSSGFIVHGIDLEQGTIQHKNYIHHRVDITEYGNLPDIDNVNYLINNAGIQSNDISVIDTNLIALIKITEKYGLQPNIKSIVNVGSVSAHTGEEFPWYAASKGGVLPYTKAIANEIAKYGATCNSISPGGVLTELNQSVIDDKECWSKIMEVTPLKKWASAEEISEWIYFMSVVNESMTGQDVIVDNGEMINSKFVWKDEEN
jgi:NAD(P)-dependent dehydrogenase (short-subunit alcohol dehydrogenase family)